MMAYTTKFYQIRKETSTLLKGVAILFMLIHHMFTFPHWIVGGGYNPNLFFAQYFNVPTRICVGMFAFITGWAFALHKEKSLSWVTVKVIDFYKRYWISFIFLLLFSIGVCNYRPSIIDIIKEATGLFNELMKFCWYVPFYVTSLFLMYFLYHQMDRSVVYSFVFGIIVPVIGFSIIEKVVPVDLMAELANHLKHFFLCIYVLAYIIF